jgi:RNA polymerase sigma factor (sigma-70 family)
VSQHHESGDDPRATFDAIFEAHHRSILAYALRRTRNEQDAEDATAETFAIAWRRIDDIPVDTLPWLYGVARRVLANQRRARDRGANLLDRLRHHRPPQREVLTAGGPATDALAALGADDRELLRLVAWEDLSQAQIAVVLGISPNAVAIRLHRARRRYVAALDAIRQEEVKESGTSRTSARVMGRDAVAVPRQERS